MYTGKGFLARLILGLRSIVPTNGSKCVGTPIIGYSIYVSPIFGFNCTYKWLERSLFGNWNIDRRPHQMTGLSTNRPYLSTSWLYLLDVLWNVVPDRSNSCVT